jgi:membrane protein implicated in regulation of membrane protease activity
MENVPVSGKRQCIVLDPQDNVATAIMDLKAGEKAATGSGEITLPQAIVCGHKFALMDIQKGEYIIKYGAQIGRATATISRGEHVHVHNVEDIVDEVRKK